MGISDLVDQDRSGLVVFFPVFSCRLDLGLCLAKCRMKLILSVILSLLVMMSILDRCLRWKLHQKNRKGFFENLIASESDLLSPKSGVFYVSLTFHSQLNAIDGFRIFPSISRQTSVESSDTFQFTRRLGMPFPAGSFRSVASFLIVTESPRFKLFLDISCLLLRILFLELAELIRDCTFANWQVFGLFSVSQPRPPRYLNVR